MILAAVGDESQSHYSTTQIHHGDADVPEIGNVKMLGVASGN